MNYIVEAVDGTLGAVDDFLFDDLCWQVRYIAVDRGKAIPGQRVLIAPQAVSQPEADEENDVMRMGLSIARLSEVVPRDPDRAIRPSAQAAIHEQLNWVKYWGDGTPFSDPLEPYMYDDVDDEHSDSSEDRFTCLRCVTEVEGYHIKAIDGELGHVEDLLIDTEHWTVAYLVVDTRNWLPGRKVLVAPEWVNRFDWDEAQAHVDLDCEQVRNSPPYDPNQLLDEESRQALHGHYGYDLSLRR